MQWLITENRSNDFGWLAVRAGIFCTWIENHSSGKEAKSSVSPHMHRNGSGLAQRRPVTQQRC
jgi:hypothetical protein